MVIEHSQETIKTVNGTIDLGPEDGDKPVLNLSKVGEIVATGTPEQVVKEPRSYTGHHQAAAGG